MKCFVLMALILSSQLNADCFDGLASTKGIAVVAITYGITETISNFLSGFNWKRHANVSEETHEDLQEAGGLIAAFANLILGVTIPIMIWAHQRPQPLSVP